MLGSNPVVAEDYINETMIVMVTTLEDKFDAWKSKPVCTPVIEPTDQKGIWQIQIRYDNGQPLTTAYLGTIKPRQDECETLVHFPEGIQGSGTFESYFPNGKTRSRIEYKDGQYAGKLQFWYVNGLQESEFTHRQGMLNGPYKIWYPNGQLALSMQYKNDEQHGLKERWYETGETWTFALFNQGQLYGDLKQWFKNGKLERQGYYRNGVRHGIYKTWFEDGKPEASLNYSAGKITSAQCWNDQGKTISPSHCINAFKGED